MEVDISCLNCKGSGCGLCKHTGWQEFAGAGMEHPEVLKNGGIYTEKYTGYAWGMGVERMLMLKRGVKDIRHFTENDVRLLRQFNGI
jgi:phenylalanyl-tRNA synthetase alpha chain